MVADGKAGLSVGPRENGHRPAVDALFRSAARSQDGRVIGVVLSGTRDDGTAGLALIKACGGHTIVQDPEEAMCSGMPASALAHVAVDAVAPSEEIAATIVRMVTVGPPSPPTGGGPAPQEAPGEPVVSICLECGGSSVSTPSRG